MRLCIFVSVSVTVGEEVEEEVAAVAVCGWNSRNAELSEVGQGKLEQ